jgi:hypothetical protein
MASPTRRSASGREGVSVWIRPRAPAATGIPFTQ